MTLYDARIASLLENVEADWGDQEENKKNLIFFRVGEEFDKQIWGLDLREGELVVIQAPKKQRKSTLLANFCINFLPQLLEKKYWMEIDTLESGMTPRAYRDVLVSMLATRLLVSTVHGTRRADWGPAGSIVDDPALAEHLRLTKKFLRFGVRTEAQEMAIAQAVKTLQHLPLSIWGASKVTGQSRDLEAVLSRWQAMYEGKYVHKTAEGEVSYEGCEHRIFAIDNVQQLNQYAGNSYQGLELVTNAISGFVTSNPGAIVFAVSQVSLTSMRAAQAGEGEMESRGGSRLSEEATLVFQTEYEKDKDPNHIKISTPYSRYEPPPTVLQPIEPFSGAFLGLAKPVYSR